MQEQPYSLAFRQKYPKFNGLIWGYHWFQVGLYEPLLTGKTPVEREAGVRATVARFFQMLNDPPRTLPYQMPMTAAVSPLRGVSGKSKWLFQNFARRAFDTASISRRAIP